MAITNLQPGDAPANPCTHKDAAAYLADYSINGSAPLGRPDTISLTYLLGDLEGLCAVLAAAFDDATERGSESQLMAIKAGNFSSAMRSVGRLAALGTFWAEAI